MTQTPITAWQKQKKKRKKSGNTGLFVLFGCIAALVIIVFVTMGPRGSPRKKSRPPAGWQKTPVGLALDRKKELYKDWCELGRMGSPAEARFEILRDRYGAERDVVKHVIDEGQRKSWPQGVR